MRTWVIICSIDGNGIDYEQEIKSAMEPDFWTCYDIAASQGCDFFYVEEL